MMKKGFLNVLSIATLLFLSSIASAATFDAAKDFSTISNPNGAWSYGYTTTMGGSLILDTDKYINTLNPNISAWETGTGSSLGAVFKNTSDTPQNFLTISMAAEQLAFHPGSNGEFTVVRWTAPSDNNIALDTTFTGVDCYGTTTDVHVLFNNTSIFDGVINGYNAQLPFSRTLSVLKGDTIDFVVGFGDNHSYGWDSTGLDAKINPVPIPAAVFFLGSGLAMLAGFKKKRRLF